MSGGLLLIKFFLPFLIEKFIPYMMILLRNSSFRRELRKEQTAVSAW